MLAAKGRTELSGKISAAGDLLQQIANGDDFHLPGANFKTRVKKSLGLISVEIPWRGNFTSYDSYLKAAFDYFKDILYGHTVIDIDPEYLETLQINEQPAPQHPELIATIDKLKNALIGVNMYIHGSMARADYTDFSDVDDLVIFTRKAFSSFEIFRNNINVLRETATAYQCMDPLQHHGHWVISDAHLKFGLHSKMPPQVLSAGVIKICGDSTVEFSPLSNNSCAVKILNCNCDEILQLCNKLSKNDINANELKLLASAAALLPALLEAAKHNQCDKAAAITKTLNKGPDFAVNALQWTAEIRNNFGSYANITQLRALAVELRKQKLTRNEIYLRICQSLKPVAIDNAESTAKELENFANWCKAQII